MGIKSRIREDIYFYYETKKKNNYILGGYYYDECDYNGNKRYEYNKN